MADALKVYPPTYRHREKPFSARGVQGLDRDLTLPALRCAGLQSPVRHTHRVQVANRKKCCQCGCEFAVEGPGWNRYHAMRHSGAVQQNTLIPNMQQCILRGHV